MPPSPILPLERDATTPRTATRAATPAPRTAALSRAVATLTRASLTLAVLLLLPLSAPAASAQTQPGIGPVSGRPMPRYVSINASEVNIRRGPGLAYRRDFVFRQRGMPVRVTDEFEQWRRIEDSEGDGGWVYHALISGRRTILVTAEGAVLQRNPEGAVGDALRPCTGEPLPATATACAERGVIARLERCTTAWCAIEADGLRGWIPKAGLWGADDSEVTKD
jgi:SH3-like domain-containing protein